MYHESIARVNHACAPLRYLTDPILATGFIIFHFPNCMVLPISIVRMDIHLRRPHDRRNWRLQLRALPRRGQEEDAVPLIAVSRIGHPRRAHFDVVFLRVAPKPEVRASVAAALLSGLQQSHGDGGVAGGGVAVAPIMWSAAGAAGDGSGRFDDGFQEWFDGWEGASEDAHVEFDAGKKTGAGVSVAEIRYSQKL